MNKKLLSIALIVIVLIGGTVIWNRRNNDQPVNNTGSELATKPIAYTGVEGQTALALLKQTHTVETKSYSFGEMVVSIDGISATEGTNFWEFLVNGQQATVGAGDYQTKSSDSITWQLSEINAQQ